MANEWLAHLSEPMTGYGQSSVILSLNKEHRMAVGPAEAEFPLRHQDNLLALLSFTTVMSPNAANNRTVISLVKGP